VRLDGFARLIQKTEYKNYQTDPYRAQEGSAGLPEVDLASMALVHSSRTVNTLPDTTNNTAGVYTDTDQKDIVQTATILSRFLNLEKIPVENIQKTAA